MADKLLIYSKKSDGEFSDLAKQNRTFVVDRKKKLFGQQWIVGQTVFAGKETFDEEKSTFQLKTKDGSVLSGIPVPEKAEIEKKYGFAKTSTREIKEGFLGSSDRVDPTPYPEPLRSRMKEVKIAYVFSSANLACHMKLLHLILPVAKREHWQVQFLSPWCFESASAEKRKSSIVVFQKPSNKKRQEEFFSKHNKYIKSCQ